jgi:hypothetical protein
MPPHTADVHMRQLHTVDAAKSTMPGRRVKGPLDESTDGDCAGLPGSRWWAGLGGIGAHCTISACSRRIHSCPICVTVPGLSVVRVRVVAISKNKKAWSARILPRFQPRDSENAGGQRPRELRRMIRRSAATAAAACTLSSGFVRTLARGRGRGPRGAAGRRQEPRALPQPPQPPPAEASPAADAALATPINASDKRWAWASLVFGSLAIGGLTLNKWEIEKRLEGHVENPAREASAHLPSSTPLQRQIKLRAASRFGQPRSIGRCVLASRPQRPVFHIGSRSYRQSWRRSGGQESTRRPAELCEQHRSRRPEPSV